MRFPKSARLLTSNEYRRVSKAKKIFNGTCCRIHILEEGFGEQKLGIVTTRRFGKAIKRNRFKRLTREAFRLMRSTLPSRIALIIRPLDPTAEISLVLLKKDLFNLCGWLNESTARYTQSTSGSLLSSL